MYHQTTLDNFMLEKDNTIGGAHHHKHKSTSKSTSKTTSKHKTMKIKIRPSTKTATKSSTNPKSSTKPKSSTNSKTKTKKLSTKTERCTVLPLSAEQIDYVFTDGSTFNNGKLNAVGGIGVYFTDNDKRNISEPFLLKPITNNRCEIYAVIKAIENYVSSHNTKHPSFKKRHLIIYCDSMYTIDLITKWIFRWKENGWKTADKKDVKNKDLIVWLDSLIALNRDHFNISFEHARAHRKEPIDRKSYKYFLWYGNMMADRFAVNASKVASKLYNNKSYMR